jgi:hypothetical protein
MSFKYILYAFFCLINFTPLLYGEGSNSRDNFLGEDDFDKNAPIEVKLNEKLSFKSAQKACTVLKGSYISSLQNVYFITPSSCERRLIEDSELLGFFMREKKIQIREVTNETLTLLKKGSPYDYVHYLQENPEERLKILKTTCQSVNEKVVSYNADTFFYIKNCVRYKLASYTDTEKMKLEMSAMEVVPKAILNLMARGPTIKVPNLSMPEAKWVNRISYRDACKKYKKTLASFYNSLYWVDKCTIHPLKDSTIASQVRLEEKKRSIQELSSKDILELKEGPALSYKEVLSRLN